MSGLRWSTPYRSARAGRFVSHGGGPLGAWVSEVLNGKYEDLYKFLHAASPRAQEMVRARARVDTGLMRKRTHSHFLATATLISIEFGWWEGDPFYAPYQEFGTVNGITPMMAVHNTYHLLWGQLKTEVAS